MKNTILYIFCFTWSGLLTSVVILVSNCIYNTPLGVKGGVVGIITGAIGLSLFHYFKHEERKTGTPE